jgi:hypothetical protein
MEELWIALGKVGGLAAIGGLIDLGMRKREKGRVKHWLIVLWDRFDSIKWSNFGQEEARAAIRIIDRVAGRRLLSVRRWIFTLVVVVTAIVATIAWTTYDLLQMVPKVQVDWFQLIFRPIGFISERSYIVASAVVFALSISVTRAIASIVARLGKGPFLGALFFWPF